MSQTQKSRDSGQKNIKELQTDKQAEARKLRMELASLFSDAKRNMGGRNASQQMAITALNGITESQGKTPFFKALNLLFTAKDKDSVQLTLDTLCHAYGFSEEFVLRLVNARATNARLHAVEFEADALGSDFIASLLKDLKMSDFDLEKMVLARNLIITYLAKRSMDLEIGEHPMYRREKNTVQPPEKIKDPDLREFDPDSTPPSNPFTLNWMDDTSVVRHSLGLDSDDIARDDINASNVLSLLSRVFDNPQTNQIVVKILNPGLELWYQIPNINVTPDKELEFRIESLTSAVFAKDEPALTLKGLVDSVANNISVMCGFYAKKAPAQENNGDSQVAKPEGEPSQTKEEKFDVLAILEELEASMQKKLARINGLLANLTAEDSNYKFLALASTKRQIEGILESLGSSLNMLRPAVSSATDGFSDQGIKATLEAAKNVPAIETAEALSGDSSQEDLDSSPELTGAHGEPLSIAGRLRQNEQQEGEMWRAEAKEISSGIDKLNAGTLTSSEAEMLLHSLELARDISKISNDNRAIVNIPQIPDLTTLDNFISRVTEVIKTLKGE